MESKSDKQSHRVSARWMWTLKTLFWAVLALALFDFGAVIITYKYLTPDKLTPLAERMANRALRANVSISRVELSVRSTFPFMNIDIDTLVITSRDIQALSATMRDTMPQWADTLVSAKHLHGGINVMRLLNRKIDLKDLLIIEPQVNILVVNEHLNNFSILPVDTISDTIPVKVPDIRLNHFALVNPRQVRFADLQQNLRLNAQITSAQLENNTATDVFSSKFMPQYEVNFESNIASPLLGYIGLRQIPVALNGVLDWRHDQPYDLQLSDFKFAVSRLTGQFDLAINFYNALTVKAFDFQTAPVDMQWLLEMLPDDAGNKLSAFRDISTDAVIMARGRLLTPYIAGAPEMPLAQISVEVPKCSIKWQNVNIERFALDMQVMTKGRSIDDTEVKISNLLIDGPSIAISANGYFTDMLTDPYFDGQMKVQLCLDSLPRYVTDRMRGALKGDISADTRVKARKSMLSRDGFHKIQAQGMIDLDNIYYLSDDTLHLYTIKHCHTRLRTNVAPMKKGKSALDTLLSGVVKLDTAHILVNGIEIDLSGASLNVDAMARNARADTTALIPMGGKLKIDHFALFTMTDSAGLCIQRFDGNIQMKRYKHNARKPEFMLTSDIGNITTGGRNTRFVADNAHLRLHAAHISDKKDPMSKSKSDNIHSTAPRIHPDIPSDKVYGLMLDKRQRHRRHGHRVHFATDSASDEYVYWGTSKALYTMLNDWALRGTLASDTATLITKALPLPNRMQHLDIKFDNDSLRLCNVSYKAGSSDFLLSGCISNIREAFSSADYVQPLKINIDIASSFININEVTEALFRGAAHHHKNAADTAHEQHGALLVPVNIDARLYLRAQKVLYSDVLLQDLRGTVLLHDGAVNLHDFYAASSMGTLSLTALYTAPDRQKMDFGFGMKLTDFDIRKFLRLVPSVDSIMPVLHGLSGTVSAEMAATSRIDTHMSLIMPSLKAAINITGDTLALNDPVKCNKLADWLLFKDKTPQVIDRVSASATVSDGVLQVYPFVFDIDHYRLGIQGHNDINMNFDYHISVLRSPLPFRFGIYLSGNPEKYKVRFGGPGLRAGDIRKYDRKVDTMRVNLIEQFEDVFRRGIRQSKFATLNIDAFPSGGTNVPTEEPLTPADSLFFIRAGVSSDEEQ